MKSIGRLVSLSAVVALSVAVALPADDLDTFVRELKSWKVPENEFTRTEKVTLRALLTHAAGLTVHGFPGYDVTERMPSTVEVLDGAGNTAPVRVNAVPWSLTRYSGGGYTVMQLLVTDVTGKPFHQYMR
jgi:CubicO group peptidase (beta-lactamase class C family)